MSIKKLIGKRIQEIRRSKKMTQEKVAELINIETVSLSNIENGRYFPSAENLDKLLNVLNITPNELFQCESNKPTDIILNEMFEAIKDNPKLIKLMYKFYNSIKYDL